MLRLILRLMLRLMLRFVLRLMLGRTRLRVNEITRLRLC